MSTFQAGERVMVSEGQHRGQRGEIIGAVERDGDYLIEVELDGVAETVLFRPSMLMKERT